MFAKYHSQCKRSPPNGLFVNKILKPNGKKVEKINQGLKWQGEAWKGAIRHKYSLGLCQDYFCSLIIAPAPLLLSINFTKPLDSPFNSLNSSFFHPFPQCMGLITHIFNYQFVIRSFIFVSSLFSFLYYFFFQFSLIFSKLLHLFIL